MIWSLYVITVSAVKYSAINTSALATLYVAIYSCSYSVIFIVAMYIATQHRAPQQ